MRRTACIAVLALLASACSGQKTVQAPDVKPSGFLGDYSRLHPGAPGQARLVYRAPDANLAGYDKMLLERVVLWGPASGGGDLPRDQLQRLADLLYGSLLARVQTYYMMVDRPGPGVLRVRAALTEARESAVALDILSSVGPITGAISGMSKMATGTSAFVGAASVEVEVSDAETGEVLLAAVDRRVGEKTLSGATDPWGDVQNAFQVWSDRFIDRLQYEGGPRQPLPYWAQPPR
jgi:hypothetical protein